MDLLTTAALTLMPSPDHQELGVGPYAHESGEVVLAEGSELSANGMEIVWRRTKDSLADHTGTGESARIRLYQDPDRGVVVDHLTLDSMLLSMRVRPELGDEFDLGLLLGTWEEIWRAGDNGRAQWRVFSPVSLTLLGFSNTDQDDDDRMKHYVSAGFGIGGETLARIAGPIGLQTRLDAKARTTNRHRTGDVNTTRHETAQNAELGLSWLRAKQAWVLGGWAEHRTQWEPRDLEGRDGVDRQYFAGGVRLSARFYKPPEPELDAEMFDQELAEMLEQLRELDEAPETLELELEPEDEPLVTDGETIEEVLTTDAEGTTTTQVHWSEVAIAERIDPEFPAELEEGPDTGTCTVRFFVDKTGTPFNIKPEVCESVFLKPTMQAVWQWRFEPLLEDGAPVPVEFLYTVVIERR